MKACYKVLIVEDHPYIATAYQLILKNIESGNDNLIFDITIVHDAESAMTLSKKTNTFNLAILDIRLSNSNKKMPISGEKIGLELKKNCSEIKLIVITPKRY